MMPAPADLVLRGARRLGAPAPVDIAVRGPRIVEIGPALASRGAEELDLAGRLVLPGFVDAHLHLDKAYALEPEPCEGSQSSQGSQGSESLDEAIAAFYAWRASLTPERLYRNARRAAERALLHGTLALRTHVTVDSAGGFMPLETLLRLRADMAPRQTIQLVAFPDSPEIDTGVGLPLLRRAVEMGADLIGGASARSADPRRFVDSIFELAGALDVDLDLHVDESDDPRHNTLEYIAERKVASGFRGLVAAGHCCALSALDEPAARRVIEKVAAAQLHVITLPACNMYLMGRQDRGLVRRGLTRVGELLAAGVNVACASDNIRDHFNPFGDADMLQVALIAALALHTGTPTGLEAILGMATERPARILRLADYGLRVGGMASFVVLDAPDAGGAIAALAPRSRVFSQGRLVARTDVSEELL